MRFLVILWSLLFAVPAFALDCSETSTYGYVQGPGGYYKKVDNSGPYALNAACEPTLLGGGASSVVGSFEKDVPNGYTIQANSVSTANTNVATVPVNGQGELGYSITGLTGTGAIVGLFQSNDWDGTTGNWSQINEINKGNAARSQARTADTAAASVSAAARRAIQFRVTTAGSAGSIVIKTNLSVRDGLPVLGGPAEVLPPYADPSKRLITKCTVAANSGTLSGCTSNNGVSVTSPVGICPAIQYPVSTQIVSNVANLGLGLNGQSLTSGTYSNAAGSPDLILQVAGSLYGIPVSPTNAVTQYNPTAGAAQTVCIQESR